MKELLKIIIVAVVLITGQVCLGLGNLKSFVGFIVLMVGCFLVLVPASMWYFDKLKK